MNFDVSNIYVFILAAFLGLEVIKRVSPLLHTPLMSLTNSISAISVLAAIEVAGKHQTVLATVLGTIGVAAAFANVVGGFMISDRMLKMFKKREPKAQGK
jgi:H+-translocating NAD(P) transhydrogenase subunit alpha